MKHSRLLVAACGLALILPSQAALHAQQGVPRSPAIAKDSVPAAQSLIEFDRDIRPLLSNYCLQCHGPDTATRQADLRLDQREGLFSKLDVNAVVDPFDPDRSELLQRVLSTDADFQMPPPGFERRLDAGQIELLQQWIQQGATWQPHWSLRTPIRPIPPAATSIGWANNAIDHFISDRWQHEQLQATPAANRETLIRRLSLDLTGLPPTPEEVAAFREDPAPNAAERVVDRLLASPHFGERLAVDWLDGARFADTSGYQNDGPRHMWRWRDWVIEAFNRNQPFDQFTVEQIAGDLLPDATLEQKIATGFQRNHRGNAEGGIVPAEFAVEYVVDRVETTSAVWLGITLGCARCHDHKYDPISQREFYQLFAFFNNIPESGRAIKEGNSPPYLLAPTEQQQARLDHLDRELDQVRGKWTGLLPKLSSLQATWEQTAGEALSQVDSAWLPTSGLQLHFDGQQAFPLDRFQVHYPEQAPEPMVGPLGGAVELDGQSYVEIAEAGQFGYFDKFSLTAWILPRKLSGAIVSRMLDASQADGYSFMLDNGHLQLNLVKRWLDDAVRVETESLVPADRWTHVAAVYDGSRAAAGIRLFIDGQLQNNHVQLDQINQSFASTEPLRIGAGNGPENRFVGGLDEVTVHSRMLDEDEIAAIAAAEPLAKIAAMPPDQRTDGQRSKLAAYYRERVAPGEFREANAELQRLRDARTAMIESIPTVMVMQELPEPRPTFILSRGQYDLPTEQVSPDVPTCLPALPAEGRRDRLGLARWLVRPDHPLTARVIVNRYWQMLFGVGLVKTSEDFGLQGERPSHSALLDWLAVEFIESGWDLKRLIKLMVTSAAYQQSSAGSQESWSKDPENRWLSRGPRFRLPAEMIRDQALAASGLLTRQIGGPSLKPYQPEGLWGEIATDMEYVTATGQDLFRRSVYTYWKRTVAPPGMQTFDAPSRETCIVRRPITNTPLQALLMMNEQGMVEAARVLAERSMRESQPEVSQRVARAFQLTTGRVPSRTESAVLLRCWHEFHERYQNDSAAALLAISEGTAIRDPELDVVELATYTAVASLILNLDEAITKE